MGACDQVGLPLNAAVLYSSASGKYIPISQNPLGLGGNTSPPRVFHNSKHQSNFGEA